jgi:hypothetical protein
MCRCGWFSIKFNSEIFIYKENIMSKEMREQINKVKNFGEFLNENKLHEEIVYHSGDIEGEITTPFYVTDNDFGAESYGGGKLYKFKLDTNSKILDLTNRKTFKEIKMKIYDNNSKLFPIYMNTGGFGGYSKERMNRDYLTLKQFKNFNEIERKYNDIINSELFDKIFDYGFQGYGDDIHKIRDYYLDNNASDSEKKMINIFEILYQEVKNIDKLDDYSLNSFGKYFYDYAKSNGFNAYKAWSTDASGQMRIIEYCIINTSILTEI